jgi:hypothetical protein
VTIKGLGTKSPRVCEVLYVRQGCDQSVRGRLSAPSTPNGSPKFDDNAGVLPELYTYLAEHGFTCAPPTPIEATFATVRWQTRVAKGPGSRAAGIAMAYKLFDAWATFHKGTLLARPTDERAA